MTLMDWRTSLGTASDYIRGIDPEKVRHMRGEELEDVRRRAIAAKECVFQARDKFVEAAEIFRNGWDELPGRINEIQTAVLQAKLRERKEEEKHGGCEEDEARRACAQ